MSALLATAASLELFAPLLVASASVVALMVLGRVVAQRNYTRAQKSDRRSFGPSTQVFVAEAGPSGSSATFRPSVILDITKPSDSELTRSFVRPAVRDISPADSAAMTLRAKRVYLDPSDIIECR